jgi:type III secretory pathway component EscR
MVEDISEFVFIFYTSIFKRKKKKEKTHEVKTKSVTQLGAFTLMRLAITYLLVFLFYLQYWDLNSGFHTC